MLGPMRVSTAGVLLCCCKNKPLFCRCCKKNWWNPQKLKQASLCDNMWCKCFSGVEAKDEFVKVANTG